METRADFEIVRMAQGGDAGAFSVLVRRHEKRVFKYVLRLVGDRSLAEDVTQEVFLRVFQGLPTFSFRCRFTTWLLQVTKNRALEELRTRRGRPLQVALDDVVPSLWIVDAPAERAETLAAMWQAIEGLSSDLKAPLLLRDVAGLSYLDIADSLDVTLATVKWRIFKARERVLLACREEVSAKPGR